MREWLLACRSRLSERGTDYSREQTKLKTVVVQLVNQSSSDPDKRHASRYSKSKSGRDSGNLTRESRVRTFVWFVVSGLSVYGRTIALRCRSSVVRLTGKMHAKGVARRFQCELREGKHRPIPVVPELSFAPKYWRDGRAKRFLQFCREMERSWHSDPTYTHLTETLGTMIESTQHACSRGH